MLSVADSHTNSKPLAHGAFAVEIESTFSGFQTFMLPFGVFRFQRRAAESHNMSVHFYPAQAPCNIRDISPFKHSHEA